MLLTKEQISLVDDLPTKIVSVPEWGGDIKLRAMVTKDRIDFERINADAKSEDETMINLIIYSCVDENNKLMFSKEDFKMLAAKSAYPIVRLFKECVDLSVLSQEKLEEKAKNS
jgi:hypothetical protein